VLYANKNKDVYPVYILKGEYENDDYGIKRLSNFWEWRKVNEDCSLGEKECGYGNFYECFEYSVKVKYEIIKEVAECLPE
jgi:hypothetical protein